MLVFFEVERSACKLCAVGGGEFHDIVIESFDRDASVLIDEGGNHVAKDIYRVGYRAAVMPGMQVFVRTCNLDFKIGKAAHTAVD